MKKSKLLFISIAAAAVIFVILVLWDDDGPKEPVYQEIQLQLADIRKSVSTTGIVNPQNRLEIKPAVAGRVESILVKEGDYVRTGRVLAMMSSEERAALIDSARAKGAEAVEYWKKIYKPISLIAPINGTIIVRDVEPGQSVTTSDAMFVISDRLIVQADVDETDIGLVKKGFRASITLDAYPEVEASGKVDHISYESTTSNNVTIYKVDILPDRVPSVFRSGMTANIEIFMLEKKDCPTLPLEAVKKDGGGSYVLVKTKQINPQKKYIETGVSDLTRVEIVSGLSESDIVLMQNANQYLLDMPADNDKTNPFMPQRKKTKKEVK